MIHILEKVANTGPLAYCGRVLAGNDRYYAGYTGHLATCPECLSHLCDGLQVQAEEAASQLRMASLDWIAAYHALTRVSPEATAGRTDPTQELRCTSCGQPAGVLIPHCCAWDAETSEEEN